MLKEQNKSTSQPGFGMHLPRPFNSKKCVIFYGGLWGFKTQNKSLLENNLDQLQFGKKIKKGKIEVKDQET